MPHGLYLELSESDGSQHADIKSRNQEKGSRQWEGSETLEKETTE